MTRQQRLTLIATILGSTVVFLDATIVNVALPSIGRELNAGLAGQQWVLEAYMLTMVSLLLVGGSLGDQFGRRRLFVIGLVAFGATSVLCALAPTEEFLIGARALQGIAGALLVPGSLAIVAATFSGEERGKAVGTWTAWTGIATVFGPAGGGALVGLISWRAIFWVNIPLIAGTVMLTLRAVEESSDPEAFRGIDVPGVMLSAAGLAGPVFALIEQPTHGWSDPLVWVPLIAGVACFAAFVFWEARAKRPMLDLSLFRIRNFTVANVTTLTVYAGLAAGLLFVGLYLQQVVGYTRLRGGPGDDADLAPALLPLAALGAARVRDRPAAADDARADRRRRSACSSSCGSAPTPPTRPTCCPRSSSSASGSRRRWRR